MASLATGERAAETSGAVPGLHALSGYSQWFNDSAYALDVKPTA
jgi:hypothetical protein